MKAAGPVAALCTLIKLSKMVVWAATSLPAFSVRFGVSEGTNTDTCSGEGDGEEVEEVEEEMQDEEDTSSFAINPWEVEVKEDEEDNSSFVTNPWEVEVEVEGVLVPNEMREWAGREAVSACVEEMEEEECYICGGECFCRDLA